MDVRSGIDLGASASICYPYLQFCPSVLEQIRDLPRGEIHLRQIMKHLLELNDYCEDWQEGPFTAQSIAGKITRESHATLSMYAKEHTFLCPDGDEKLFSWHCRVTPEPWRIYFFPWEEKRLIIIGYVGHHLPTVRYST